MNCTIPGQNLKVIGKALQALSKIGDELLLQAKPEILCCISMNSVKTAFATFHFRDSFFSVYEVNCDQETNSVLCKVPMKGLLNIFKKSLVQKDKKIEFCKIEFKNYATKMNFKVKYKDEVTVVHSLNLIDYEPISILFNKDMTTSCITASGDFFTNILSNFQMADEDTSLEISNAKVIIRNYDLNLKNQQVKLRSQVTVLSKEFLVYKIDKCTSITLVSKSLRSAVTFAEAFDLQLSLHFDVGGRPAIIEMKTSTFEVSYVLSTISAETSTQSSLSTSQTTSNANQNHNLSVEDQEALQNEKWEDFEMIEDCESGGKQLQQKNENTPLKTVRCLETSGSSTSSSKISMIPHPSISASKVSLKSHPSFNDLVNQQLNARQKEKEATKINVLENIQIDKHNSTNSNNKSPTTNTQNTLNGNSRKHHIEKQIDEVQAKKLRTVFARFYEEPFRLSQLDLGAVLAENSDSE